MKNRIDIRNFIVELESKFPVNSWRADGIHLWPIIRLFLYFHLVTVLEGSQAKPGPAPLKPIKASFLSKLKASIKRQVRKAGIVLNYFLWLRNLPRKKFVFVAADAHRVNYKGKRYNRFFDVLIDTHGLEGNSLYFEYGDSPENGQFHIELIRKYQKAYAGYFLCHKGKPHRYDWAGFNEFLEYLKERDLTAFAESRSVEKMESWFGNFSIKVGFFTTALKTIQPTKILTLCYYSHDVLALIAAANKLGIETIEMQHGPQTDIHLAYGSWSVVPSSGYDMLPRTYWCWDQDSKNVINQWGERNTLYAAKVVGNPWVDYWKTQKEIYSYSDYILYSLQPNPLTIPELLPQGLISFIREQPYKWFLRLHPRQMHDREKIERYLHEHRILEMVNIEDATNDPLPLLLSRAKIHVTHFSGTAIEASFFNVFTVLINPIGVESFPELIAAGKAQYLDVSSDSFADEFVALIEASRATSTDGRNLSELAGQHLFD